MKKRLKYFIFAGAFLFASCSNWLDLQPEDSVSLDELFKTEEGFYEALNGVFLTAADYNLYGGIFSIEMLDAMMQNYSFAASDYTSYAKTAAFDFSDGNFKSRINTIWSQAYSAIVNCNLILENIDEKKDIFQTGMYELIKGEALAIRAYIHLDMLRYFGPRYAAAPNADAIPYVTTYSNKVTKLSTVTEVLDYVIADLTAAKTLMQYFDPIISPAYIVGYPDDEDATEEDFILFLSNRRHRMNYYAVCGTLARAYLWKDQKALAAENAMEVILSDKFPWTLRTAIDVDADTPDRDRIMYTELVFGWYIQKEVNELKDRFDNPLTGYSVQKAQADRTYEISIPSVGAEDLRLKNWFTTTENNANLYKIIKYLRNSTDIGNKHPLMSPAIRISEMYYILAECTYDTDPQTAWGYLNTVREARAIRVLLDNTYTFTDELLKEYRKETYCEGQAFLHYKRLNRNITGESATYTPAMGIYNPPLPENETEFRE